MAKKLCQNCFMASRDIKYSRSEQQYLCKDCREDFRKNLIL